MQELETHESQWICFINGDESAFEAIYYAYVGILYTYGYHIVSDSSVVKEEIQDLFVDLWKSKEHLSEVSSVKHYLFRCLRRRLHKFSKRDQLYVPFSSGEETELPLWEQDIMEQEQKLNKLQKHMRTLPPRQQEVLHLRFYEGFSVAQIAQLMNLTPQSVSNLLHRSILRLREAFAIITHCFFMAIWWL